MRPEYRDRYEKFGLNVVCCRKRRRPTRMRLAERVETGRSHISAIEPGKVGASFDVMLRPCGELEITPKQLFDFREQGALHGHA